MENTDIGASFYSCSVCTVLINWNRQSKTAQVISTFVNSGVDYESKPDLDLQNGHSTAVNSESNHGLPVCAVCLGILDRAVSCQVLDDAIQKLNESNYDTDTFNLAITLPPSCLLREKAARIKKEEEKDEGPPPFVLSLKDACRVCYQAGLEQRLESRKIIYDAQSDFTIAITFENSNADDSCTFLQRKFPDRFSSNTKKRKRADGTNIDGNNSQWSRSAIMDVLPLVSKDMIRELDIFGPKHSSVELCTYSISLARTPLFIGGRYCKYSRYLTQTPWMINGVRRGHTSVQELICNQLSKAVGAEEVKFTSSGREDTDVRMLGDGRPFAIQLVNCRRKRTLNQEEIDTFQKQINSSTQDVSVLRLRIVSDQEFTALKIGEEQKKKTYVALIWCPDSLAGENERERILALRSLGPIELEQKTPIRVLHRRPLAVRKRTVEILGVTIVNEHYFQLRMKTQAGTYVKEFVHGDFGRTKPSLSDLLGGIPVDILELDVEHIDLAWP